MNHRPIYRSRIWRMISNEQYFIIIHNHLNFHKEMKNFLSISALPYFHPYLLSKSDEIAYIEDHYFIIQPFTILSQFIVMLP